MDMRKLMATATLALYAGTVSAQRTISENVSLTADSDWSADGTITINAGTTLDLAGHSLKVSGLAGEGSIVSTDNLLPNASFENFTVTPSGNNGNFPSILPVSWTYIAGSSASAGWCKSRDSTWSKNLDAKDGTYSVFFWCQNASSGGAMVSNTVNITVAGRYRLSFWTAARPGNAVFLNMRVHADVDGVSRGYAVCSAASWKETVILLDLSAGEHSIAFRSDGTGGGSNPCGLLDKVSLSRIAPLRLAHGAGATYSCQLLTLGSSVIPTAETQTLTGTIDWRGLGTVTVADGEKIDLAGNTLYTDGLVYDKAASERLGVELIVNGNLESVDGTPSGSSGTLSESMHFTSWGWSHTDGSSHILWVANSGSGNWCSNSPNGNYYVGWWVNANNAPSSISQTINVPADGTYRLSFLGAERPKHNNYLKLYVHADVDGASQGYVILDSTTWTEKTIDMSLTAGEHVIALRGIKGSNSGSNPCGGIDKISLVRVRNSATCVTNSTETLSELHMNIASGTMRNDLLPIGGNLKLVKEGSGTYVSGMVQTYAGGTLVAGGTVQPPDGTGANATYSGTKYRAFGTGVITVSEEAVFDLRGNYDYNYIALDGGTLRNSGFDMSQGTWDGASIVSLTKDSYIDMQKKLVFGDGTDAVDLNGKTLFVNAARGSVLTAKSQSITNGTISSSGEGWLETHCRNMNGVCLEVASAFAVMENIEVLDYTSSYLLSNYDGARGSSGSGVIGIAGTFKPLTDYWHGCELHDGATIDLSERSSELSAVSSFSTGATNLAFTAGARVSVKLGTRTVSTRDRIIGWTGDTKPANVGTVKFVRGDADRCYGLVVKDDGLYIVKGMMIFVK